MEACCPNSCQAWQGMAPPTPAPAPTPVPEIMIPEPAVDPARPYVHATLTYDAPYEEGGNQYNLTKDELAAEAKYHNELVIQRIAVARAKVAADNAEAENQKLLAAEKPEGNEKEAPLAKTPMVKYARKSLYWDKRPLDLGPVDNVPTIPEESFNNLQGTCMEPPCPDMEMAPPKSRAEQEQEAEEEVENAKSGKGNGSGGNAGNTEPQTVVSEGGTGPAPPPANK